MRFRSEHSAHIPERRTMRNQRHGKLCHGKLCAYTRRLFTRHTHTHQFRIWSEPLGTHRTNDSKRRRRQLRQPPNPPPNCDSSTTVRNTLRRLFIPLLGKCAPNTHTHTRRTDQTFGWTWVGGGEGWCLVRSGRFSDSTNVYALGVHRWDAFFNYFKHTHTHERWTRIYARQHTGWFSLQID